MLLIVSRFVVFFIVNITFSCLVQGFIIDYPSKVCKLIGTRFFYYHRFTLHFLKIGTPGNTSKKRSTVPPTNHVRYQAEPYHQQVYEPHEQEQFNQSAYRASRYPDVVSPSIGQSSYGDDFKPASR